jgi:hypothetical protein
MSFALVGRDGFDRLALGTEGGDDGIGSTDLWISNGVARRLWKNHGNLIKSCYFKRLYRAIGDQEPEMS